MLNYIFTYNEDLLATTAQLQTYVLDIKEEIFNINVKHDIMVPPMKEYFEE